MSTPSLSDRPFVDRPIADLDAATTVAEAATRAWSLPAPRLLRVGMNALFVAGDVIVRVGASTQAPEAAFELSAVLGRHGLRVPEPVEAAVLTAGDLSASGWRRLDPCDQPVDWVEVGRQVRVVHGLDPAELPPSYPVADPTRFPWWDFDAQLAETADLLDADAAAGIERVIERAADWRHLVSADQVLCHGDVHPGNVMMAEQGPVLLDWDLLCWVHPAWDHAMLAGYERRWGGSPQVYRDFVAGYGAELDTSQVLDVIRDLRDVAAVLMRVAAGRTDAAARREADRRLELFRGAPDPPVWRAQ